MHPPCGVKRKSLQGGTPFCSLAYHLDLTISHIEPNPQFYDQ
jgi:hypothetical protein